jgi:hypothetical protein
MIAARGLGETTDTGHRVRIIVKGFIKVPDAEEKNDAGILRLESGALLE